MVPLLRSIDPALREAAAVLGAAPGRVRREIDLDVPQLENAVDIPPPTDDESARLFEEAQRAMATGEATIRILQSQDEIRTGFVRVNTLASPEIERTSSALARSIRGPWPGFPSAVV